MNWYSSESCGWLSSYEDEGIGGTPSSEDDKAGGGGFLGGSGAFSGTSLTDKLYCGMGVLEALVAIQIRQM